MSEQKVEKKVSRTVAIALGIICIILAVGLVGTIADYTSIISGKDNTISSQASFKEPPTLTIEINTSELNNTVNLKNDLEGFGCKIINSTNWGTPNSLANYTEFRRIAYNTGVVFWNDSGIYTVYSSSPIVTSSGTLEYPPIGVADTITLYTIFDGTILSIKVTFTAYY